MQRWTRESRAPTDLSLYTIVHNLCQGAGRRPIAAVIPQVAGVSQTVDWLLQGGSSKRKPVEQPWGRDMRDTLAALLVAGWPLGAAADQYPVVVELFTSQGCSSCPPADAMLDEMAEMPGIIALALHVDYWDYIGWADTFAQPEFTLRQEAYARAAGERTVYTPQLIVGGVDAVVGADAMAVMEHVQMHAGVESAVDLEVTRDGDVLRIDCARETPALRPMTVQVVRYRPSEVVEIGHGENAGHRIDYANIVTSWQTVAEWRGLDPMTIEVDLAGNEPVVVIVQEPGPGRIVAAAEIR